MQTPVLFFAQCSTDENKLKTPGKSFCKPFADAAAAVRTSVVFVMAWLIVFITGAYAEITAISVRSWVFLILSGLATGASWLCYFKALSLGVSWLFMRENPALMVMVVPFVVIGYFGSLGGLFSGVRAVRELRHAGIIRE